MRRLQILGVCVFLGLSSWPPVVAQTTQPPAGRDTRRLFQRFAQDAVVIPGGWLEGQFDYSNLPNNDDLYDLDALIAFSAGKYVEAGIRFGFASLNASQVTDGSGFSDIDLYGKYVLPGGINRLALGGLLKVPTADEEKNLGTGQPDLQVFGAWRANFEAVTITANAGISFNGSTDPPLPPSEDSVLLGAGLILPLTAATTFVLEWSFETEQVTGGDNDSRLTPGFQMMFRGGKGGLRGAVGIPLSDGAPDWQLIVGAFYTY